MMYVKVVTDDLTTPPTIGDSWFNPMAIDEISPHDQDDMCHIRMRDGRSFVAQGSPHAMAAWWWQHVDAMTGQVTR